MGNTNSLHLEAVNGTMMIAPSISITYQNFSTGFTCNDDMGCFFNMTGRCFMWKNGVMGCANTLDINALCVGSPMHRDAEGLLVNANIPVKNWIDDTMDASGFCDRKVAYCSPLSKRCTLYKQANSACSPGQDQCEAGHACISTNPEMVTAPGVCSKVLALKESCYYHEQCASGLCHKPTQSVLKGTCVAKDLKYLDPCVTHAQCLSGKCRLDGKCDNPQEEDSPCSADGECSDSTYCDLYSSSVKRCMERAKASAKCNRDRMCRDGLVCTAEFTCGAKAKATEYCHRHGQCERGSCNILTCKD